MAKENLDDIEDLEQVESLGRDESKRALYALLFVSDRPLSASRLAEALGDNRSGYHWPTCSKNCAKN